VKTAASLFRLATCLGIAAGAVACERGASPPPPAKVSAVPPAAKAVPANDSTSPVARDSADRCRWEEPVPMAHRSEDDLPRKWDEGSMERGVPLRCVLRDGGPEVRVVVGGIESIPMGVQVYFPADARTEVQTLALDNDERASERSSLAVGEDLNDDGWTDLLVQTWSGSGGVVHDLFMWNPRRSRFEQDSVFPRGTDISPLERRGCAGTAHRNGAFNSSGGEFCWSGGRWHLVRRWTKDKRAERFHVRRVEEMRDGRVLRVRIDTVWLTADSGGGAQR